MLNESKVLNVLQAMFNNSKLNQHNYITSQLKAIIYSNFANFLL